MIHSMQEKEQALEKIKQEEIQLHYDLDKKHMVHVKNKNDLDVKINEVECSLEMMKHRKRGVSLNTSNEAQSKTVHELMLDTIGERVKAVYKELNKN